MTKQPNVFDQMQVTVPEGTYRDCSVKRFEVTGKELESLRYQLDGRGCQPGTYTRLDHNGVLWMSDTTAERYDHGDPAYEIRDRGGRVLIGGLGLGMILNFALLQDNVTHVDVVEISRPVIKLVGAHYRDMAKERGKILRIHQDDVFKKQWPRGTRWNVAWFDVWPDITDENLASMTRLRRSYGRRADWVGCWSQELLRSMRGSW